MNQRLLEEAASSGDIDSLYSIIEEDAYVLDRIDQVPFVHTPLHISASAGHVHFSLEIMRLKPSLAKKLNPQGYSPIHLACQNEQTEVVFRLIEADRDLVNIQGREGSTPLHIIASYGGKDEVLAKFLISYPKSMEELNVRKESALHIAVKNDNIEALKILLEWTSETCMTSIQNWSNDEGNNIMHLAAGLNQIEARGNQIEMVKLLLKYKVDIRSKNLEGSTAVDILRRGQFLGDRELRKKLDHVHILKQLRLEIEKFFEPTLSFIKRLIIDHREILDMSKEDRNAVLVVSVLIATATYQALLSPPDKDMGQHSSFKTIRTYTWFILLNTLAFAASMIEIFLHLPSGFGYSFQLVLPLVICYMLLMIFWRLDVTGTVVTTVILLSTKIPMFRQKISRDLPPKKLIKLGALLKCSPRMERELNEINAH